MQFSIRRIRKRAGARDKGIVDVADELARKGMWLTLVSQQTGQGKRVRLYYRPKPLLILFSSLALAGYLAAAVALTWWLGRMPFNRVSFFDVSLPWRWSGMNALRGDGFSAQGLKELSDEQFQRGVFYLGRGLSLQPDNPEARLALASFYAKGNYYDGVSRTVKPQFKFGFSSELAKLYLQQAGAADDSGAVLAFVDEWRDRDELTPEDRELLADWSYRTRMHLDEPAKALAAIDRPEFWSEQWTAKRVSALVKLKRFDDAWALAAGMRPAIPGMFPLARRTQVMVLSRRGDLVGLKRVLDSLIDEATMSPEAWIFAVEQTALGNFHDESGHYLAGFYRRFGAQPEAVNGLLMRLIETKNIAVVKAAAALAKDWQTPSVTTQVGMGLLWVGAGEWRLLREDWPADTAVDPELAGVDRLMQGILRAIGPEANDEALRALLSASRFGLIVYRELTLGMAEVERWDLVKLVADTGNRYFPHSSFFLDYQSQAEERLQEVVPDVRLTEAVAEVSRQYGESDIPALKFELRKLVVDEKWDDVESIVRRVRRQRPAWLNQVDAALDDADARAGAARGDVSRLIRLAPAVLRRDGNLAEWFTDQAELAIAAGNKSQAKALLEAVLAEEKFYHRARTILKALTAVPKEEEPEAKVPETKEALPEA